MNSAFSLATKYFTFLFLVFELSLGPNAIGQNIAIDSLQNILKSAKDQETRFNVLTELTFQYRQSKPDSSLYYGLSAVELGNQMGYSGRLASTYNFIGLAYQYKGEFSRAFDYYQSALRLSETAKNESQIGHSHNNMGRLFLEMGDAEQSWQQFLIAKVSFEKAKDLSGQAYLYRSFSEWHEINKNYDSAINYSEKALKLRRQLPNRGSLISAMLALAQQHLEKKEYYKTAQYLHEAEIVTHQYQDPYLITETKIKIIELMIAQDSLAHINENTQELIQLLSKGQVNLLAKLNLLQGKIATHKNDRSKSVIFFKEIVDNADVTDYEVKNEASTLLIESLYTQGDFKEAEKYRLKAKVELGKKRNRSLVEELEKINLKFGLERQEKLRQEMELTSTRKRTTLLTVAIFIFGGLAVGIILVVTRKRNKDTEAHKEEANILLQKLTDSERKNKKLLEESLLIICTHDMDGKLLTINSPGARTIGYEPAELMGKNIENIIPEGYAAEFKKYMADIKSTGTSSGFINVITKWKENRIFLFRNVLVDEDGGPTYVMGSALDVTEWKKAEHEEKRLRMKLADSERLYRLLSENSSDLVCLHGLDGTYQFVSSSVTQLLGYQPFDLVGVNPYSIVHQEDQERFQIQFNQQLKEGNPKPNVAYRMKRKDGAFVWMETYTQPIADNNQTIGFQTSSRDITVRREYEEALRVAKDKAEEATRYKSEFVSSMSHEIRTPLNAIIGLADILLKRNPREEQVKIFQMLKSSGDTLLSIVNDILDFSKVEAGKMELEETMFNLPETGREVVQLFQERAIAKRIALRFIEEGELPKWIKGDQGKIRQVISNLVSNALKFTAEGSVEVTFKLVKKQNGLCTILFMVSDSGIGIETDKLDLIFESFAQVGQDTARKYGGTGLGLAIVKKLVSLMSSEILVESELGKGSRFYFTLLVEETVMTTA